MAAAVLRFGKATDPVLVAFIATHTVRPIGSHASGQWLENDVQAVTSVRTAVQDLDIRLLDVLPAYMIPSFFILIPSIPLQPSGKTDYKRLQELTSTLSLDSECVLKYSDLRNSKRQPSNGMAAQLQKIWSAVLGLEPTSIGMDDNLFRLGADSVSLMRAVTAAQSKDVWFTVSDVFQNPTLEALSVVASTSRIQEAENDTIEPFSLLSEAVTSEKLTPILADHNLSMDNIEDIYPCTPFQESLLALSMQDPGSYVNQEVFELARDIDLHRFKAAWEEAAASYDILRTTVIHANLGQITFLQVVLKSHSEHSLAWAHEESLASANSWRFEMPVGGRLTHYSVVCDTNTGQRYFVLTIHHALYDASSLKMIYGTVQQAYDTARIGKIVNFNTYVRYIQAVGRDETMLFWQSYLADADPSSFPDGKNSLVDVQSQDLAEYQISLSSKTISNFTTATFIHAAWALLISRYTGNKDVVFGATLDGRSGDLRDIVSVAGPTVSTCPLRYIVDPQISVVEFLTRVQDDTAKMIGYAHFGIQNIKSTSQQAERACQFRNLLVVQPRDQTPSASGLFENQMPGIDLATITTYPLALECQITATGIDLTASFDSGTLSGHAVSRMLRQFEHILHQLQAFSKGRHKVGEVRGTSKHDEQLIREWNAHLPTPVKVPVHELIHRHTMSQPSSDAVCAWDGNLTYQELDALSTRLACQLVALGVVRGSVIPVCSERSMWVPVALLGITKAGGTFVLMDATVSLLYCWYICYPIRKLKSSS
jgi:aryl carrier-like protein